MKLLDFKKSQPSCEELIRYLEDLSSRAKSGELKGIAGVVLEESGSVGTFYTPGIADNILATIGGFAVLQARLLEKLYEV